MNTKTVIIAGSRNILDYDALKSAIESSPWFGRIDTVYTGDAKGVDEMVVKWCKENGITYRIFRAQWHDYGRQAGPLRNEAMINEGGEALILLWYGRVKDGFGRGSKSMKEKAKAAGIPIHEVIYHDNIG